MEHREDEVPSDLPVDLIVPCVSKTRFECGRPDTYLQRKGVTEQALWSRIERETGDQDDLTRHNAMAQIQTWLFFGTIYQLLDLEQRRSHVDLSSFLQSRDGKIVICTRALPLLLTEFGNEIESKSDAKKLWHIYLKSLYTQVAQSERFCVVSTCQRLV